jgi:protein-tyrosine phosphatase
MAEAFLRERLAEVGVADVHVHSAGLFESGRAAPEDNVAVMAARGVDLTAHRSVQVTNEMLDAADLVVTMARDHVREVAVNAPQVWPRAFTLRELVRRGQDVGPRQAGQPLDEWIAKVHAGRTAAAMVGMSQEDDVADPMGRSRSAYEAAAAEIDDLITQLVPLVWETP